ncbi:hypothetical protein D3C85_898780 [compost metagenome]
MAITVSRSFSQPPAVAGDSWYRRSSTANTATLLAVARKAATGAGAPSYTSGVQRWKGTRDSLNARPISIMPMPIWDSTLVVPAAASWLKLRLPASA